MTSQENDLVLKGESYKHFINAIRSPATRIGYGRWAVSYKDIYDNYNYDSLNYVIDILYGLYSARNQEIQKLAIVNPLEEKKTQMIKYEIIAKFCHYAENLGAFILAYRTHHLTHNREIKILSTISKYWPRDVDPEYRMLTRGKVNSLWRVQEQGLKNIFGYYAVTGSRYSGDIRESLINLKEILREIYDCYRFYKESYNSYKHGYRLWFARDHKTDADIAINLKRPHKRIRRDYVPTDGESISLVLKYSQYCRKVFDILVENERHLSVVRKRKTSKNVEISFLKKGNSDFEIQKQICFI